MPSEFSGFLVDGRLPCAAAFRIKETWRESPRDVGEAADEAGIHVSLCQLGFFGYEEFGNKRMTVPCEHVPDRILEALGREKRDITCARAWALAEELAIPRLLMGSLLDAADVRITDCQLGCF